MLITTNGLVTRAYDGVGTDRIIQLVTQDRGRLTVLIKGGQKRSGIADVCLQLFAYGNYELYERNGRYWYRGGSLMTHFFDLSADLEKMALGAYLCDLTGEMTASMDAHEMMYGQVNDMVEDSNAMLRMLLNALHLIQQGSKQRALIKGVFELRTMAIAGYTPSLEACALCETVWPDICYLDVMNGRIICADCQSKRDRLGGWMAELKEQQDLGERRVMVPMTKAVLAAVRYVLGTSDKKIFSFVLKDHEDELCFAKVAETFLLHHLERGFDTLHFYHSVAD